jgi:hypothetical protein
MKSLSCADANGTGAAGNGSSTLLLKMVLLALWYSAKETIMAIQDLRSSSV